MRAQIVTLLILLYSMNMVSTECSDFFEIDCLYDTLFGEDSEENSSEEKQIVTDLSQAVSNLSTTLQNTLFENEKVPKTLGSVPLLKDSEAKLDQVPNIVNYLINLTKVVKNVHVESSKKTHANKHNDILSKHKTGHNDESSKSDESDNSSENESKLTKEVSQLNKLLKSLSSRFPDFGNDQSKSSSEEKQVIHKKHSSDSLNKEKTKPSHVVEKEVISSNEQEDVKADKKEKNENDSEEKKKDVTEEANRSGEDAEKMKKPTDSSATADSSATN